jgi:hypothetical protein
METDKNPVLLVVLLVERFGRLASALVLANLCTKGMPALQLIRLGRFPDRHPPPPRVSRALERSLP